MAGEFGNAPAEALGHMLTFIDELAEHAPTDADELRDDVVRGRFVLHTIALLGEAARRLGAEFHAAHPDVPWGQIIGTRNRIVHAYDRVNYRILAAVLASELPVLRPKLAALYDLAQANGSP